MTVDTASTRISRPAAEVFAFMANPDKLGLWSFGTWTIHVDGTGLIRGTSIRDGSEICLRIAADATIGLIDFHLGPDDDHLQPRIFARVTPATVLGGSADECLLTMTSLRTDATTDAQWASLKATHAFEVDLIKSAVETGYDHRTNTP